jgi:hypothetical protein
VGQIISCFVNIRIQFDSTAGSSANFFNMTFSLVLSQVAAPCKRLVTQCTAEWLFACVHSHMLIKMGVLTKQFATQYATVWLFA